MKDAKVIAQLVKVGRYDEPTIPQGVYAIHIFKRYPEFKHLSKYDNYLLLGKSERARHLSVSILI